LNIKEADRNREVILIPDKLELLSLLFPAGVPEEDKHSVTGSPGQNMKG